MAVSDDESKFDEMERDNLQSAISVLERRVNVFEQGEASLLAPILQNMKGRVATLEKKIKESQVGKENHAKEIVQYVQAVEKEKALSAPEKETFSDFLKEEFFTKNDFARLDQFYARTWDRLSDDGKDEMSHRFWEGIRRDEYQFKDAPQSAQEKETEWAYATLVKRQRSPSRVDAIPEKDRTDFIRAYEGGREDEAREILGRKSFRENMSLSASSKEKNDITVSQRRDADGSGVETKTGIAPVKEHEQIPAKSGSKANFDLSALNLDSVTLAEAPAKVSSSDIPSATVSTPKGGPLLRGG